MVNQVSGIQVRFGSRVESVMHVPAAARVELACRLPQVEDIDSAVHQAMADPVEFPPVEQAIVEGDRVVLAVDPSVPQMPRIVRAILAYLHVTGCAVDQFSIVIAGHDELDRDKLNAVLSGTPFSGAAVELHDADDSAKLAYVAANKQGDPIYLNRTLVDADVVISLMCARAEVAFDYQGAYGIFPLLSDRKTRGQFLSLKHLADPAEHQRLQSWADEAAWWGGMMIAVQIIPSDGDGVAAVIAGGVQEMELAVQTKFTEAWATSCEGTYDAVVVLIDGDQSQQTWNNVARALSLAVPYVTPDGMILVCSELKQSPGAALRRLADPNLTDEEFYRKPASKSSDDALAAAVLHETSAICHVYLLSDLDREDVESLGLGALRSPAEAEHALHERRDILVLGTAQHRTRRLTSIPLVDSTHECSGCRGEGCGGEGCCNEKCQSESHHDDAGDGCCGHSHG